MCECHCLFFVLLKNLYVLLPLNRFKTYKKDIAVFPLQEVDFQGGFKYLGFFLKPSDYRKNDWKWMIEKTEKRTKLWCNTWLSLQGTLTLVKSMLEAISIYWHSLAVIPKRILESIKEKCLNFFGIGK